MAIFSLLRNPAMIALGLFLVLLFAVRFGVAAIEEAGKLEQLLKAERQENAQKAALFKKTIAEMQRDAILQDEALASAQAQAAHAKAQTQQTLARLKDAYEKDPIVKAWADTALPADVVRLLLEQPKTADHSH